MAAKKKSSKTGSSKGWFNTRRERVVKDIKRGRGVSLDFFRRHGWLLLLFTVVILVLTGMRYRTRAYMNQINKLNTELRSSRNDLVAAKSEYMSLIREKDMVELSRKYNLGLEFPLQPAFILPLDATDSVAAPKSTAATHSTPSQP